LLAAEAVAAVAPDLELMQEMKLVAVVAAV
jgi:hypothetical protein